MLIYIKKLDDDDDDDDSYCLVRHLCLYITVTLSPYRPILFTVSLTSSIEKYEKKVWKRILELLHLQNFQAQFQVNQQPQANQREPLHQT